MAVKCFGDPTGETIQIGPDDWIRTQQGMADMLATQIDQAFANQFKDMIPSKPQTATEAMKKESVFQTLNTSMLGNLFGSL